MRSGRRSTVSRIVTYDGDLALAGQGQALSLVLADHTDVGRGDLIVPSTSLSERADQFAAHVVWLDEAPLLPSRNYYLKIGTQAVTASVTALRHRIDVETGGKVPA